MSHARRSPLATAALVALALWGCQGRGDAPPEATSARTAAPPAGSPAPSAPAPAAPAAPGSAEAAPTPAPPVQPPPPEQPTVPAGERAAADECEAMLLNLMLVGYRGQNAGQDPPPAVRKVYEDTVRSQPQAIDNCVKHTRRDLVRCVVAARTQPDLRACKAQEGAAPVR